MKPPKIKPKSEVWKIEIESLTTFFDNTTSITGIKLNEGETITNGELFLSSHFQIITENQGNKNALPFLNRLYRLKTILQDASNTILLPT